jgi:sulfate-transporting ATPase
VGGFRGLDIGRFEMFGLELDSVAHPQRYALVASGCLLVVSLLVANLRRNRVGRRLVAVRSNERAAAALGISVFGAKLFAFGLGSAIAAVGGILLVFGRSPVVFRPTFSVFESISAVLLAVLGGIGFIAGAAIGAVLGAGGLAARGLGSVFEEQGQLQTILSALVLVQLVGLPDGIASIPDRLTGLRSRRARAAHRPAEPADVSPIRVNGRALRLEDVSVRFGGVVALDQLTLTVSPGEVVGLIGPNGAGKTTALDAATGFHRRHGGRVWLGDREVTRWATARRARAGLGRSFQSLELFESMTVRDNLLSAADRRDLPAYLLNLLVPERRRRPLPPVVDATVREFDLEDDLDRPVAELPFGRRRLVSVARAVAMTPSILLLDEPAAGLDRRESAELGRLTRRLAQDWGMAVLVVEHDMELVFELCDRVAVLDFGRLIADGPPGDVRRDAAVRAAYLGDVEPEVDAAAGTREQVVVTTPREESEPLIAAEGLAAGYGDLAAARDIDLTVRPGEVVALLGPNGAGKTTTMLALAGELRPLAGTVRFRNRVPPPSLTWRARHGIAFVPQERSIIRGLTVRQNLGLTGKPVVVDRLVFPDLAPLLSRRAGVLSGGEQQMLVLERALMREPDLLLVDELSQGLAPLVTRLLLQTVRTCADEGLGVLLVEQYVHAALEIADRVIVMARGRICMSAPAAELRADPTLLEEAYLTATGAPG